VKAPVMSERDFGRLYATTKRNAVRRGIRWLLSKKDFWELVRRSGGRCELSGIEFEAAPSTCKGGRRPFVASVDRLDSQGGYEPSNCRLVVAIVNQACSTWGDVPLLRLALSLAGEGEQWVGIGALARRVSGKGKQGPKACDVWRRCLTAAEADGVAMKRARCCGETLVPLKWGEAWARAAMSFRGKGEPGKEEASWRTR